MAVKDTDVIGSYLPILGIYEGDEEKGDFRDVPKSDHTAHRRGESYQDDGQLGGWESNGGKQFDQPTSRFAFAARDYHGAVKPWGADREDMVRGHVVPKITERPQYQKNNYELRSTRPSKTNVDFGNTDTRDSDDEFRHRNHRAKGFLTRPRIPTER
jgi:hypothetical protein